MPRIRRNLGPEMARFRLGTLCFRPLRLVARAYGPDRMIETLDLVVRWEHFVHRPNEIGEGTGLTAIFVRVATARRPLASCRFPCVR